MGVFFYSDSYLKYKYPTKAKDTFDVYLNPGWYGQGVMKTFTETVSTSKSVAVPAGLYKCIHYRRHQQFVDSVTMAIKEDDNIEDDYVAPDIGLIKSVFEYSVASGPSDSLQLKRFRQETVLLKYTIAK